MNSSISPSQEQALSFASDLIHDSSTSSATSTSPTQQKALQFATNLLDRPDLPPNDMPETPPTNSSISPTQEDALNFASNLIYPVHTPESFTDLGNLLLQYQQPSSPTQQALLFADGLLHQTSLKPSSSSPETLQHISVVVTNRSDTDATVATNKSIPYPPYATDLPKTEEEVRMSEWVETAQQSGRTKAPPPSAGRAGTVSGLTIKGMELEKWNGAHLEHYSRPSNHVFPLFRYEAPFDVLKTPDNSEIEAKVSQMISERRSTAGTADSTTCITTTRKKRPASNALPQSIFKRQHTSTSTSTSSSLPSNTSSMDGTKPPEPAPESEHDPQLQQQRQRKKTCRSKQMRKDQKKEYGWNRPEYLITPSTTYKTGNTIVWNRVRQAKEDKEIRVPFERTTHDTDLKHRQLTMEEQEELAAKEKHSSTAFLSNGLPKKSMYDPNRTFQLISARHGGIALDESTIDMFVGDTSKTTHNGLHGDGSGSSRLPLSDGFKRAQGHVMKLLQIIERREMSVNKLFKTVSLAKKGKSRHKRDLAKKNLTSSKLCAKLDVIRSYTVDIALVIDEWRRTVDKAEIEHEKMMRMRIDDDGSNQNNGHPNGHSDGRVYRAPPYGLTKDTTTTVVDSGTFFGLPPPPRPFLWRGINYMMKMTNDLQFLDTTLQGSYFGAPRLSLAKDLTPLLPKIGLVSSEANPLLMPVPLNECTGRTKIAIIERSKLPLSVRFFRGLQVSSIRAAATVFEDEIIHFLTAAESHQTSNVVHSLQDKSLQKKMMQQQKTRIADRTQSRLLVNGVMGEEMSDVAMARSIVVGSASTGNEPSLVLKTGLRDKSEVEVYKNKFQETNNIGRSSNSKEEGKNEGSILLEHALAVASDLDAKASIVFDNDVDSNSNSITTNRRPLRTRERLLHDLIELNFLDKSELTNSGSAGPTIKSMAVAFAQKLINRNYAKDGRTVPEKYYALDTTTTALHKGKNKNNNTINIDLSPMEQQALNLAHALEINNIAAKQHLNNADVTMSPTQTTALDFASNLVRPSTDTPDSMRSVNNTSTTQKEALHFANALKHGTASVKSTADTADSADGVDGIDGVDGADGVDSLNISLPNTNSTSKTEVHHVHPLSHVEHSFFDDDDDNNDNTPKLSNPTPKTKTTTVQLHATIEGISHDVSIMYTNTTNKIQLLAIDDVGEVHRIIILMSDVQQYLPTITTHQLDAIIPLIGYRQINHDGRGYEDFLVFVPLFDLHHPSAPSSPPTTLKGNTSEGRGSGGGGGILAMATLRNAPHVYDGPRTSRAAVKIQALYRARRARHRVEFWSIVKGLKKAKNVSKEAATLIQAKLRGLLDRKAGASGISRAVEKRLDEMTEVYMKELMLEHHGSAETTMLDRKEDGDGNIEKAIDGSTALANQKKEQHFLQQITSPLPAMSFDGTGGKEQKKEQKEQKEQQVFTTQKNQIEWSLEEKRNKNEGGTNVEKGLF